MDMELRYATVKTFAEQSVDLHDAMKKYADNAILERKGLTAFSECSKEEMEKLINKEFALELAKQSGYALENGYSKMDVKTYVQNPQVKYFADKILSVLVDMVMPMTLLNGPLKYFAEFHYADFGDSISFHLENNALMTVSEAGRRKNHTNLQKLYRATDSIIGVNHQVTTGTDYYEILTNFTSLAREVMKVSRSIETIMYYQAYDMFNTQMTALTGNLEVANYSSPSLLKLCQTIESWNQGAKPVILGTPVALNKVLPSNGNYRYLLGDDYAKIGYLQQFQGYDVVPLAQVADYLNPNPYSLKLDDTKIYVVSPGAQKIVQIGLFGGTISYQEEPNKNANELVRNTTQKAWGMKVITNAVAGTIKNLG